jgi:hypothetical protein
MRAICGVIIMDRVRNEDVRKLCGSEVSIGERMYINVLMWYGHVARMQDEIMVKRVYGANVEVSRARRRPKIRWMCSVNGSVERRGMIVEEARRCVQDRSEWRRVVYS